MATRAPALLTFHNLSNDILRERERERIDFSIINELWNIFSCQSCFFFGVLMLLPYKYMIYSWPNSRSKCKKEKAWSTALIINAQYSLWNGNYRCIDVQYALACLYNNFCDRRLFLYRTKMYFKHSRNIQLNSTGIFLFPSFYQIIYKLSLYSNPINIYFHVSREISL